MKKLTVVLATLLLSGGAMAQQSLWEAAEACKDLSYTEYYDVRPGEGEAGNVNMITGMRSEKSTLSIAKNRFGKPVGVEMTNNETGKKEVTYNYRYDFADHYSFPICTKGEGEKTHALVMVDSVLFELEKVSQDLTSYKIKSVWVPKVQKEKAADDGEKKKMSLKEKAAAMKEKAKSVMAGSGKVAELRKADLNKMLDDYIASMKEIQKANPLTPQENEEVAIMQFAIDSSTAAINAKNDAYWASEEGQRKLAEMRKEPTYLVNDTGAPFWICYGSGVSTLLDPGESKQFHYSTGGSVYMGHPIPNNSSQASYDFSDFMFDSQKYSGKTVNVSAVMPKK